MLEEQDSIKKRRIVDRFLAQLTKEDPQMYYATTAVVSRQLHLMIREHINRLPIEEQLLVKGMSMNDIEMMLSFHEK